MTQVEFAISGDHTNTYIRLAEISMYLAGGVSVTVTERKRLTRATETGSCIFCDFIYSSRNSAS